MVARLAGIAALVLTLGACGGGDADSSIGFGAPGQKGVRVVEARLLAPATPDRTALYADIANPGTTPDTLVAIASPIAGAGSLHEMFEEAGMMRMAPVAFIVIPVGSTISLAPGGFHGMLEDLAGTPPIGDSVQVTFTFAKAEPQTVWATVQDPADAR